MGDGDAEPRQFIVIPALFTPMLLSTPSQYTPNLPNAEYSNMGVSNVRL